MIKKHFYLFIIALCCGFALTACSDDDNDNIYIVDENWQADNERVFAEIAANPEYTELKSLSNGGSIYYKVLEPKAPVHGDKDTIYYTSKVKVHYFGVSMDETSRKMEYLFDSADYPLQAPNTFSVNGVVDGFATALQHMFPGDRWEIWIPWQLGYGSTGSRTTAGQSIRPWSYSTLKFEVEVLEVVQQ